MYIRVLALLAFAFLVLVTPSWAQQSCIGSGDGSPQTCNITFSPGNTTGTFDFSATGDGVITFQFDTVLTTFELIVSANEVASITNLDPTEFPTGTVCITYTKGVCVRYDVSGNAGGPNGVPVKDVDYKGLISLTLNYNSFQTVHIPAFGHAPGDNATDVFSEDILTFYVDPFACPSTTESCDPGMGGKTPGISSLAALDKPFANGGQGDTVCSNPGLTAVPQASASGQNPIVEVSFKLVASNCSSDPPLRDKTATLSVGTLVNGNVVPTTLVNGGAANKFHFDNKTGLNIQDINTNGLPSGTYYVTVISTLFSPVTTTFTIP